MQFVACLTQERDGEDEETKSAERHRPARGRWAAVFAVGLTAVALAAPAAAQEKKPNILFIMGDDIGWMQPSYLPPWPDGRRNAQHRPHRPRGHGVHRLLRHAELHLRAQRLLHRHVSAAHRDDPAATARAVRPTCGPAPRRSPSSCYDLGYTTGEFGKNHLGDHTEALPTAHGFQEYWGYLYHLDAMQQVSFPDINKTPTEQGIAPPCKNTPIPGVPEVPGAVDPKTTTCLTPPRPVLCVQVLRRHA